MKTKHYVTFYTILFVAMIGVVLVGSVHYEASRSFSRQVQKEQESRLRVARSLLQKQGALIINNGKLMAGSTVLNGDSDFVDRVSELVGGAVTIFQGDTRIATNVRLPDGSRAVGTKLGGAAYERVFKRHENFRGEAKILNEPYYTAFDLLRDTSGNIIGAIQVGTKKSQYSTALDQILLRSLLITFVGIIVVGVLVYYGLSKLTREVQRATQKHDILLESVGEGIFGLDPKGRCTFINSVGLEILGYSAFEVLGKNWHYLVHHHRHDRSEYPMSECNLCHSMRIGKLRRNDEVFWRKDATAIPVRYVSSSVIEDGKFRGVVVSFNDITERKLAEAKIESKSKELEKITALAERAIHEKFAFFASISHELRESITQAASHSNLLLNTSLNEVQRRLVENIYRSSDTLTEIVDQVLDLSQIEAGKLRLQSAPFKVSKCLENVFEEIAMDAAEKKIQLRYEVQKSVPEIMIGDETRIHQILESLLRNAIRCSEETRIEVQVNSRKLADQHEVQFIVSAPGFSISPEKLTQLCNAYSRAETSAVSQYGIMGLTLALAKHFAELAGGTLWTEREKINHCSIHFTIQTPISSDVACRSIEVIQPNLDKKVILIADEDSSHRKLLSQYAKQWGMQAHELSTKQDVLDSLRSPKLIDAIVLSELVAANNIETTVHEIHQLRPLPLILLRSTGHDLRLNGGLTYLLSKPTLKKKFHNVLLKAVAQRSSAITASQAIDLASLVNTAPSVLTL
jgi:PAS domain S-box-containing protein